MTTPAPLRTALDGIQKKMLIDFEGATHEINHKGLRGREREAMIARVKGLKKLTYAAYPSDIEPSIIAYGQRFTHFPMWGAIFAYSGSPLPNLAMELRRLQADLPMERWIDMAIVLNAGLLLYRRRSDGLMLFRPEPDSVLCAVASSNPLMPATLAIQDAFGGVWMPQAKLGAYLGLEAWGQIVSVEE